jgi:hypothetical protein
LNWDYLIYYINKGDKKMETNYEKQAEDFMTKTGTTLKVKFQKYDKHFADDKGKRDIYRITLKRAGQSYTFSFGQSIVNTGKGIQPTAYDVLTCLTKYDPESFDNFCAEYGYDNDSRKVEKQHPDLTAGEFNRGE